MINILSNLIEGPWFYPVLVWSLIWKGLALWRAAKNNSKPWFVVILVVNTVGILEIIYYFFFSKPHKKSSDDLTN